MNQVRNIQWLNQNRYRAYPFTEDQVLPEWMDRSYFVDLKVVVYNESLYTDINTTDGAMTTVKSELELTKIVTDTSVATIDFKLGDTSIVLLVDLAALILSNPTSEYLRYSYSNDDFYVDIIFGKSIVELPAGTYDNINLRIEPAVVLYRIKDRVNSIVGLNIDNDIIRSKIFCEESSCTHPGCSLAPNANNNNNTRKDLTNSRLSGDVYFEEGFGVKLIFNKADGTITIDSVPGVGGEDTAFPCVGLYFVNPCGNYIYNLNGLRPDQKGKIDLIGKNLTVELKDTTLNTNVLVVRTQVTSSGNNCGINNAAV